jgi:hypothetical protein
MRIKLSVILILFCVTAPTWATTRIFRVTPTMAAEV